MNVKEVAKEYADKLYEPEDRGLLYEETQNDFIAGSNWQRQKSIVAYRDLCPLYRISPRYECGNASHRKEWNTKKCDMNCLYMKNLLEKI